MNRIHAAWLALRDSLWFVPAVISLASVVAALVLIEAEGLLVSGLAQDWPRVFGAGAGGSRAMLAAIATSMITVAGVVFSITVVALSLASSQFSPRVLRNYMGDRTTQVVFGVFVGIFAYCLVVLRTLRGPDDGDFIPSLAVLGGMAYAFAGIGLLIYFIHHVADSIQASTIIARITRETLFTVDWLFPAEPKDPAQDDAPDNDVQPGAWTAVSATRSGYVTGVDDGRLVDCATQCKRVVHLLPAIGDFVIEGETLAQLSGTDTVDAALATRVAECVHMGDQRTVDQDAAFGVQQLVDVALRAISPGINDPSTACLCIDRLASIVVRLADRAPPKRHHRTEGQLRLVTRPADYGTLLSLSFDAILAHSRGDIQVLLRVVNALHSIERVTQRPARRRELSATVQDAVSELRGARPRRRAHPVLQQARALRARLHDVA